MGKITPDQFLSATSKSKSGIFRLTIKRNLIPEYPQLRKALKHAQKKELINGMSKVSKEVIIRFSGDSKLAAALNATQINKFSDSLANIFRLQCFTEKREQKKKLLLVPTPANPKSKRQEKLKIKKRKNKERRIKRNTLAKLKAKEIQRQKTFAQKKQ